LNSFLLFCTDHLNTQNNFKTTEYTITIRTALSADEVIVTSFKMTFSSENYLHVCPLLAVQGSICRRDHRGLTPPGKSATPADKIPPKVQPGSSLDLAELS